MVESARLTPVFDVIYERKTWGWRRNARYENWSKMVLGGYEIVGMDGKKGYY